MGRDLFEVSGGRHNPVYNLEGEVIAVEFGLRYGYKVKVQLGADDLYIVQKVFDRGEKFRIKKQYTGISAEQVGEICREAGFQDDDF
jgi:hypothetical protein